MRRRQANGGVFVDYVFLQELAETFCAPKGRYFLGRNVEIGIIAGFEGNAKDFMFVAVEITGNMQGICHDVEGEFEKGFKQRFLAEDFIKLFDCH